MKELDCFGKHGKTSGQRIGSLEKTKPLRWLSKVCSVLLGLFGFALGLSADFAVLLSALFLAHPVHTESVPQKQLTCWRFEMLFVR